MRHALSILAAALAVAGCAAYPDHPVTQQAKTYAEMNARIDGTAPPVAARVDARRLVEARTEPENWLTYYGAYDGQRWSPLDQIDRANVADLRPEWVFQAGVIGLIANPNTYSFEAAPLVVDGVMYVSGWDGYVWALDAATGDMLWQYKHAVPLDTPLCCGNVNRGVAVAAGKIFVSTANGYLVALDATNGEPLWQKAFADVRAGESATAAPLVVKDRVIVGSSGAEYGVRGHLDAFEIETGRRAWRLYTVPGPGEPGSETWGGDDAWATGGGSTWITGTYDSELDLLYWGTGNPGPDFDGGVRPGDNLYTSSVLAIDPDDGSIRWHYQWTPHDVWDYDGINENILFDAGARRLLAHFDKNGHLFVLDRTDGSLQRVVPFGRVTWGSIDPATGAVTRELEPTPEGTHVCPGPAGLKEWPHAAYSRETGLLYTPVVEACATFRLIPQEFREGMAYWGGDVEIDPDQSGAVKAFDPLTGELRWEWENEHPVLASVLATAGGLVFAGLPSGHVVALDAEDGRELWRFQTGSGIHSNPVTYSIDGRQYLAVPTGWGGWVEGYAPELYGAPRGTALVVFTLPAGSTGATGERARGGGEGGRR